MMLTYILIISKKIPYSCSETTKSPSYVHFCSPAKCFKLWRQSTLKMAAIRHLIKYCTKSRGCFKLESLSCYNTTANTSPQKMSSFCQVKDREDALQISTVEKWPVV